MKTQSNICPECGGRSLYSTEPRAIGHAAALWPGLGGFLWFVKVRTVVCADCGLTRFYARDESRKQLATSSRWTNL